MLLRKITLNNFRQFYGEQEIEFSVDPVKNITLIHAENGVGKTAFLNSLLWCLFEVTTDNFNNKNEILNSQAKKEGKKSYSVSVEFEEDDEIFLVQRGVSIDGSPQFRVFQQVEGSFTPIRQDPAIFINSIVPKDIARYFFFQGEGIGSMTTRKGGDEVRNSVREILGFKVAEFALKDLRNVRDEYRKEAAKADKSGQLNKIETDLINVERLVQEDTEKLKKLKDEIVYYQGKIENYDKQVSENNHEVVKQKHSRRLQLESLLKKAESNLADAMRRKSSLIKDFGTFAFSKKIRSESLDFIDNLELEGKIPAPFNESLVRDILKNHACICGACIEPGTEAFKNINSLLAKAADPELMGRIQKARSLCLSLEASFSSARNSLKDNERRLASSSSDISDYSKQLEILRLELSGVNIGDVANIEKKRKDAMDRLGSANRNIGVVENRLNVNKARINSLKQEKAKFSEFASSVNRFSRLAKSAEEIISIIDAALETSESNINKVLIGKVNKFLARFVRQDYLAKINESFQIFLIDSDENKVAESDGQALLLSLTFISALIELAKERKYVKNDILTSGAVAPFVIDAPFGVLDNKYKGNVAASIPDSVNQVIFLLSSSHWEGSVEDNIRAKVGKEYNMVLEVSSEQGQKSEDYISVGGQNLATVRHSAPVERTVIEEVAHG